MLVAGADEVGRGPCRAGGGGAVLLPRLYGSFLPRNPQITVTTEEGGAKSLLRNLLEKTLDLAFVAHSEPLPEAFSAVPVVSTETVWCVARTTPCAAGAR